MTDIHPFEVLPIKSNPSEKEIKRAKSKIVLRYFPSTVYHMKDEEFGSKVYKKYNDLFVIINGIFKKGINTYNLSQQKYNEYKNEFNTTLNKYTVSQLKDILNENNLEITGNKETLKNRIIENVPSKISEINLWEVEERKKYTPDFEKILKKYENNFLIRILEIKNLQTFGDKFSLIKQITTNIDKNEIENLIRQVEDELNEYRVKLNRLTQNQLKVILDNNNLRSDGNKDLLIKKILDNLPLSEMDENIKKASVNKEKALKKLFDITGKTNLKSGFKNTLKTYGLSNQQGIEIRNKLVSLINNYKVSPKDVETELNKLLLKKSKEIESEILNEFYSLVGKTKHNSAYSKQLKDAGLNDSIGNKIKNEIITEIKSKTLKKEDLVDVISFKIKMEEHKVQDEKLEILYEFAGKNTIKSSFSNLLKESYLTEDSGLKIKKEMINSIKSNSIEKEDIIPKIKEIIKNKKIKVMLSNIDESFLNQITLLNNIKKEPNREKQIASMLNNISPAFNDKTIEENLIKINSMKNELNKLYKKQLEFILKSNKLSTTGTKNELISIILSNLHIDMINLYINEITNINSKLNELTLNELFYILKLNEISVTGDKSKVINEINKNILVNEINNSLNSIKELISKLNALNKNELDYIAKINNINTIDDASELAFKIKSNVDISTIAESFSEIENIKGLVYLFNDAQRKHLLIDNNLPLTSNSTTQCNEILENVNLEDISSFNKRIKSIEKKLNSFNNNQLHYILVNNNQNITLNKEEQIEIILNNLLINIIEKDIKTLEEIENTLNNLDDFEIENLIEKNHISKAMTRSDNIKRILESIPIKTILKYLEEKHDNHIDIETIINSNYISFVQEKNGKQKITPVKNNGLKLLILFEDEEVYDNYISNSQLKNLNISKLEKPFEYFKNIVIKSNIEGILFKMHNNTFILKSEQIY